MITEVKDVRPKYASLLRQLADQIEKADIQPTACLVQIHTRMGGLVRAATFEDQVNMLEVIGGMQMVQAGLLKKIMAGTQEVQGI